MNENNENKPVISKDRPKPKGYKVLELAKGKFLLRKVFDKFAMDLGEFDSKAEAEKAMIRDIKQQVWHYDLLGNSTSQSENA